MSLISNYVQIYGQLANFFDTIRQGQAPEKFTRQHLKDIGFKSSNHHAIIPLLKALNFLTADGTPTQRYRDYLDKTRSRKILGEALREAYSDIFTIRANPKKADKASIAGKFKSTFNSSDNVADLQASTFLSLLQNADIEDSTEPVTEVADNDNSESEPEHSSKPELVAVQKGKPGEVRLSYNIQIQLPATKDIEVYNAIFKSVREHLIE